MTLHSLGQQHQALILRREAQAAQAITAQWHGATSRVLARLHGFFSQLQNAEQVGQQVNLVWLYQGHRLTQALGQIGDEMSQFSQQANTTVQGQMSQAHQIGQQDAHLLLSHSLGSVRGVFHRPQPQAQQALLDSLDSGPIAARFAKMSPDAVARAKSILITGVANGWGPRQIAAALRKSLGIQLDDALRLARTEAMNAYRAGSLSIYQANADVLNGWEWLAEGDACPFCLSMNGQHFSLDTPLDSHPNCRCTQLPDVKSYEEILAA